MSLRNELRARRDHLAASRKALVDRVEASGRDTLTADEDATHRSLTADITALDERLADFAEDDARRGDHPGQLGRTASAGSAARLAPLDFDVEQLRELHGRLLRRESGSMTVRAASTISAGLPGQLWPQPVVPQHDNRVLDRLQGGIAETGHVDHVVFAQTTGNAGIVAEGALKPEVIMPTSVQTLPLQKIAAHVGAGMESLADFDAFGTAIRTELSSKIIDVETTELLLGDGTTGHLTGIQKGASTFDATGTESGIDAIEEAVAQMREGSSLAEANLLVLHPTTWSNLRRTKDLQGRYLVAPDPSVGPVASLWGVNVMTTTAYTLHDALLIDTNKVGRVLVRSPLTIQIGYAGTDFTQNIVRFVCEERIAMAIEHASAACHVSNLDKASGGPAKASTSTAKAK